MLGFQELPATKRLRELAKSPYDLTVEGNLSPERIEKYLAKGCGFSLLYGTERIDDAVMQGLKDLAEQAGAIEKMKQMQAGEIMNRIEGFPSEDRKVLHTAVRDYFDQPNESPAAKEATAIAKLEVEKLKVFMDQIEGQFKTLVMIGIGGSDLGPRANYLALEYLLKPGIAVHFISNVDPDDAAHVFKDIDLSTCLVGVVSKSGSTLETYSNEQLARKFFVDAGLESRKHFLAITGKESSMDNPENYLESFYIWDWIGGRYSSTSMVGGVMLSFAFGINVYLEWLRGASAMDKQVLKNDLHENLPLLAALLGIWNHNFLGYSTYGLMPYSQGLVRYAAHLQQVDMESNGKRIDRFGKPVTHKTGPIVWGEPGTNAQHSFFQLIHQGKQIVPVEFIGFKEGQYRRDIVVKGTTSHEKLLANLFAQSIALATGQNNENPNKVFMGNRPSHLILSKQLNPYSLGALLSFLEHKIAFQGFIWNINSFDQEGVQLGKVLANKLIERFKVRRGEGVDQSYPLGDAYLKQLEEV